MQMDASREDEVLKKRWGAPRRRSVFLLDQLNRIAVRIGDPRGAEFAIEKVVGGSEKRCALSD